MGRYQSLGLDPNRTRGLRWLDTGELRRFVMAGGSDSHGDLNYRREGYFQGTSLVSSSGMGTPRNLVHVDRAAAIPINIANGPDTALTYTHETTVQAITSGEFMVTDGPVLRIVVDRNQNGQIDSMDTPMGGIVHLYGEGDLPLLVEWKSTPEFGAVKTIDLYLGVQNNTEGRTYAPLRHGPRNDQLSKGMPSVERYTAVDGLRHARLDDNYWFVTSQPGTSLRIARFAYSESMCLRVTRRECDHPGHPPGNGTEPDGLPHTKFKVLSGRDDEICNITTVLVACSQCDSTDPAQVSCTQTADSMPIEIPFADTDYAGSTRAVILNLNSFHAARDIPGNRFFIRAFARTHPKAYYTQSGATNISRYAYTNPIWAISPSYSGNCPSDSSGLDRDGDLLPDGCDPNPDSRWNFILSGNL